MYESQLVGCHHCGEDWGKMIQVQALDGMQVGNLRFQKVASSRRCHECLIAYHVLHHVLHLLDLFGMLNTLQPRNRESNASCPASPPTRATSSESACANPPLASGAAPTAAAGAAAAGSTAGRMASQ